MRQGGAPPTGKWVGSPQGGVEAPEPILLPDARTRFAVTAVRLDTLARSHPMMDWLSFMADLSRAQHAAACEATPTIALAEDAVEQAVSERMPPLSADVHDRDPAWRQGLAVLLNTLEYAGPSPKLEAVIGELRGRDSVAVESLADSFLGGSIGSGDAAAALFVAAALQVYFTRAAAVLPSPTLRLLPERGLCPCCGATPVSGVITASGRTPGTRYLYCSLCSTAWNHVRAICITCGGAGRLSLKGIDGGSEAVKAEACESCQTYAKMLYEAKDTKVDPYADDLASIGLDLMMADARWARHAPNPLLLAG